MELLTLSLKCIYLMLPAYAANMAPVWFKNAFSWMAVPLDRGALFRGEPLFGSHKTLRGVVTGIVLAMAVAFVQYLLRTIPFFQQLSLADYGQWLALGFLMGSGALIGDLIKSFIKRRVGIQPGKPFIPFDQVDFVAGALLLSYPLIHPPWEIVAASFVLSFVLHIVTNHVAFWLKIRQEKW